MRVAKLAHDFVEEIPSQLADSILYVSIPFATAVHRCCCGCGVEVVTPISPTDWELSFNGAAVSLWPSIGNWSFPCRSHYWIDKGRVRWAGPLSEAAIAAGRQHDCRAKDRYYGNTLPPELADQEVLPAPDRQAIPADADVFARFKRWWLGS